MLASFCLKKKLIFDILVDPYGLFYFLYTLAKVGYFEINVLFLLPK